MERIETRRTAAMVLLAAGMATSVASAQPGAGDTIDVDSDSGTWWMSDSDNAITIPEGADGVIINNGLGGVIRSELAAAIETSAFTTINNSGQIFGGFYGINFVNGLASGSLFNAATGTIASDSRAVNIGGAVELVNAGSILGTGDQRNGTVYSDTTGNNFSILNSGTIDAGAGNQGAGVGLEIAQTTATITNSGLIQGRTSTPGVSPGSGLSGDGLRLANFTPLGAGEIRFFDGTITNSAAGTIASESSSGTVAGLRVADSIGFRGLLDNAGTITGPRNGVYFGNGDHAGGVVANSGLISSDSRAFNLDGTGLSVSNSGQILGTGDQRNGTFYADGTADDYTVGNSGVIDAGAGNRGSGFGAEIGGAADGANTFVLNNAGVIRGRGDAGAALGTAGDGVRIGNVGDLGVAELALTNTGTIASEGANGTVAGVRFVNGVSFDGVLDNSGTISGARNGVYFGNAVDGEGADHSNGVVNNSGLISSGSRAFNLDGTGLTVKNAGGILATGRQRNGTLYVDGTADAFKITNLATGRIDATGGAGSGLSIQVGTASDDVQRATVINNGLIAGSGDLGADAGVRLFTPAGGATYRGNISNALGGLITSSNGYAVLVEEGVNFDGALINAGTIDGGVSLATGDLELLSTSEVSLDISGLNAHERIEITTGTALLDGVLALNFLDLASLRAGDTFDLLDAAEVLGSIDAFDSGPVVLDTSEFVANGTVSVIAVPGPATLGLLIASGVAGGRRRR